MRNYLSSIRGVDTYESLLTIVDECRQCDCNNSFLFQDRSKIQNRKLKCLERIWELKPKTKNSRKQKQLGTYFDGSSGKGV